MGQVIVYLPLHAFDLLMNGVGNLGLASGTRAFGLARQDGQRRLEAVCQVARLGDRTPHRPLAMLEQRVQIVDERLDLARVFADDPPILTLMQPGQTRSQPVYRGQPAAHLPHADDHAEKSGEQRQRCLQEGVQAGIEAAALMELHHLAEHGARYEDHSDRPEDRARENATPERRRHGAIR
jgi:hypothetical protein